MKQIPFFSLNVDHNDKKAIMKSLSNNWLSMGPQTLIFEKKFAELIKTSKVNCVATSSCTASLHMTLLSLNLQKDDEVILPSLTFVADINTVIFAGGKPVLADINSTSDLTISAENIEKKITKKTKVVIIVHYAGYECDMKKILELKKKYKFFLIEDACHALVSKYKKTYLGLLGDVGVFSFYSNKNMTTGEGGMIVSKNKKFLYDMRSIRNHGISKSLIERNKSILSYNIIKPGLNYRIDDLRATLGISQIRKLKKNNIKRKNIAKIYKNFIIKNNFDIIIPFQKRIGYDYSYHLFPIILPPKINRDHFVRFFKNNGIQLSFHYIPIHKFKIFKKFGKNLRFTDYVSDKLVSLPLYADLGTKQQDHILKILFKYLQKFKKNPQISL